MADLSGSLDTQRAIEFVERHGAEVERARLRFLLTGERPEPDVVDDVFSEQRADGGWASFWAPDYSSLDATCFRLAQAEQLGLIPKFQVPSSKFHVGEAGSNPSATASVHSPSTGRTRDSSPLERAAEFIQGRQHEDGSWEEDESVRALAPPWAQPGDVAARLYLTANCGYWLAMLDYAMLDYEEGAERAAGVLQDAMDAGGHIPSFLHAHWLMAGLLYRIGSEPAAQTILSYLAGRIPDMPASNLAWMLVTLLTAGMPAHHPCLRQAAEALAQAQQADGRWASEDGASRDVHTTVEALRALGPYTHVE